MQTHKRQTVPEWLVEQQFGVKRVTQRSEHVGKVQIPHAGPERRLDAPLQGVADERSKLLVAQIESHHEQSWNPRVVFKATRH